MTDILQYISTWSVLQWVVLVLVAGFIGQFGRMLAEAVIARVRLRRMKQHPLPEDARPRDPTAVLPADHFRTEIPSGPPAAEENSDKKALKAMAKTRKKEAKRK